MPTIGLVGVGAMGARVGGALVAGGAHVVSVLSDRTPASRDRALGEGITDVADLGALVAESRIVLSIVPPGVASAVAGEVVLAAKGSTDTNTVFVDCNAISPGRSREIAGVIETGGMTYVDGGLIGAPPAPGRPTALYLSGEGGDVIAEMLRTDELRAEWLGPQPAAASALKMAYAAWTKGVNALVLSIRALARGRRGRRRARRRVEALTAVGAGLGRPGPSDREQGVAMGRGDGRDRGEPRRRRHPRRCVQIGR